jgi:hypothetical protein
MPLEREYAIWESAGLTPLPHAYAMYEVQTDLLLRQKGIERIMADPLSYLSLTIGRVWDFWVGNSFYLFEEQQGVTLGFSKDAQERGWVVAFYSLFKRLVLVPTLIIFACYSTWIHRDRWKTLLPLYVFPIGLTVAYVPFTVEAGRYALPVLPCLMMLSVAAVHHLQIIQLLFGKRRISPGVTGI